MTVSNGMTLKPCVCGSMMPPEMKELRGPHLRRFQCTRCGFHGAGGRHIATLYTNWNRAVEHRLRERSSADG